MLRFIEMFIFSYTYKFISARGQPSDFMIQVFYEYVFAGDSSGLEVVVVFSVQRHDSEPTKVVKVTVES